MSVSWSFGKLIAGIVTIALVLGTAVAVGQTKEATQWTPAGWGGGGFYYAAAFHPAKDGVLYLGGDVNGMYKSIDHGKSWRIINNGLPGYGVFSIAVDPKHPDTVYAANDSGLSKSTDAGETWTTLPQSDRKGLRLTGEKGRSTRSVAIDPTNGDTLYVASPSGIIHKSMDGGQSWAVSYQRKVEAEQVASMRFQFGKVNSAIFGGFWTPLKAPDDADLSTASAFGLTFNAESGQPRDVFVSLTTTDGGRYRSRNVAELFGATGWREVVLTATDFQIDPELKAKSPDKVAALPTTPDWAKVNRIDVSAVAGFETEAAVARVAKLYLVTGDAQSANPTTVTLKELGSKASVPTYGNLRIGEATGGSIFTVTVSPAEPTTIAAATSDVGVILSADAGQTWRELGTPKRAVSVAFAPTDANVLFAACGSDGLWRSTDKGVTWAKASEGIEGNVGIKDVAVSPVNRADVYAIGSENWNGRFYYSNDGGATWTRSSSLRPDPIGNPTLPHETADGQLVPLSNPTNIVVNPLNPQQLFISANWRNAISNDRGRTWSETARGADISCITDIRFLNHRTYVSAMDEGVLYSDDAGANWNQLWPLRHTGALSGHYWRLNVQTVNGNDRILSAASPWEEKYNNFVVASPDGGATFSSHRDGLPTFIPRANTMWGRGYARALATDPTDPNTVYLGIDGDPADGNKGGGLFKSNDGGQSWTQLPNQPGSRRMYYGLAVDPTNSQRLYWGGCADRGGLYRSEDGGNSWEHVFSKDAWIFNVVVTPDGTVYCPGKQLHRSDDHGKTWKQISKFPVDGAIVGLDVHPTHPKTIWAAVTTWGNAAVGAVYKTTDGGTTWSDITGDLPYVKPLVLRYNPKTNELWAGGVGLYRVKQ